MHRLIYKSSAVSGIDKKTFREILYISAQKNRQKGVTGALLATESHYLQVLEGEYAAVNSIFQEIANDRRHDKIEIITFTTAPKRIFSGWKMRGLGLFQLNRDLEKDLMQKYGIENGSVRFPSDEKSVMSLINDVNMNDQKSW